jgi:ATP-binding cassette subfamily B protein
LALLPIITKGLDSVSSIGEILSATDIEDNTNKTEISELHGEYEFKNVAFSYEKDQRLLEDFSIHIKAGETIAFVGESGCGKTTTVNLALGFNLATGGEILVDGRDIKTIDLHSYRSHIAIVPQNSVLFTGTIRENITYGIENVSEKELAEAIESAQLTSFINSLPQGIDTVLSEHGANLSGGQRQRISIARAIIRKPSVIIFDEATSALDSVSEREIQKAIDNLTKDHTTFIVAHRLSTIKNADRIAVLKNGRCEELGSYDELMAKKGLFYTMQTMQ